MEITARVFNNGKLIGYQVTDGSATKLIDLNTAIFLAKTGKINNVKATQDGITGINGFELRKLSQINKNPPQPQQKPQASVLNTLSPYIELLAKLTDDEGKTVGYQIGYTGKQPLQIRRIKNIIWVNWYNDDKRPDNADYGVLTLNYGDVQCVNNQEFEKLVHRPEINYEFSNFKINVDVNRSRRLISVFMKDGFNDCNSVSIYDVLDSDIIYEFFTIHVIGAQNMQDLKKEEADKKAKTMQVLKEKGLFNAFKR